MPVHKNEKQQTQWPHFSLFPQEILQGHFCLLTLNMSDCHLNPLGQIHFGKGKITFAYILSQGIYCNAQNGLTSIFSVNVSITIIAYWRFIFVIVVSCEEQCEGKDDLDLTGFASRLRCSNGHQVENPKQKCLWSNITMKIDVRWPACVWQINLHKHTVEFDWMHDIPHQQQNIWIIIIIFSSVLKSVYITVQSMHAYS